MSFFMTKQGYIDDNKQLLLELKKMSQETAVLENKYKAMVEIKDKEIEFFKDRGNRYLTQVETREKESVANYKLSQEVLQKVFEATTKVIECKCKTGK